MSPNTGYIDDAEFIGFENLTGGDGDDGFTFVDSAGVLGAIAGGGGANTIDYSFYVGPVTIDLALGSFAGTAGATDITVVIGSAVGDALGAVRPSTARASC